MPEPLSRRTLLRGAGVALSLPWLESMQAATGAKLSSPPLRLAYLFMPNGTRPDHWTPAGDAETGFEFTPHLKPLEKHRSEILILENLWNERTQGRNGHWPKVPAWLHGGYVERSTGKDLDVGGTSADQVIAQHKGHETPLPSLELGCEPPRYGIDNIGGGFARIYGSYISWRDPHTPVPKEIVPQLAFDRLFRGGGSSSGDADNKSVLDAVLGDAKSLQSRVSSLDRLKLDEYYESLRTVERRLDAAAKPKARWVNSGKAPSERPPAGIPANHVDHVRLMFEVLMLAFWTDSTRVATFMLGDAQSSRDFSFLDGVKGNFHGLSHHRDDPDKRGQYERIVTWHVEQVSWFLDRMRSIREGDGTLLDHSLILFGSTLKCGNRHDPENLPLILAGRGNGTVRTGRRLRASVRTPMCNLHLSLLNRMGVEMKSFGDSTGTLANL